jgi:hypothetical protein
MYRVNVKVKTVRFPQNLNFKDVLIYDPFDRQGSDFREIWQRREFAVISKLIFCIQ